MAGGARPFWLPEFQRQREERAGVEHGGIVEVEMGAGDILDRNGECPAHLAGAELLGDRTSPVV